MGDLYSVLRMVGDLTVAGLLALIVVGFLRGFIVTGREYRDMKQQLAEQRQETESWKVLALKGTALARYAVDATTLDPQTLASLEPPPDEPTPTPAPADAERGPPTPRPVPRSRQQ